MHGDRPNETQIRVWNAFAEKLGWHDRAAHTVARVNRDWVWEEDQRPSSNASTPTKVDSAQP